MIYEEAINTIISEGMEEKAIHDLLEFVYKQRIEAQTKNAEYRACLRAINKINAAHIKDDSIRCLSELEMDDKK